ncbi:hypothetical protein J6590_059557 [Homalodisca vitripennis]|nr:hypothetical protein J6590_059557 [Homalodisca vitripennis]
MQVTTLTRAVLSFCGPREMYSSADTVPSNRRVAEAPEGPGLNMQRHYRLVDWTVLQQWLSIVTRHFKHS